MPRLTDQQRDYLSDFLKDKYSLIFKQAQYFAKKNHNMIIDIDDLYQEACITILTSFSEFDPKKGTIDSFIRKSIRNALINYANKNNSPLSVNKEVVKLSTSIFQLEKLDLNPQEVISTLHITNERYNEVRSILTREVLNETIKFKDNPIITINEIKSTLDGSSLKLFLAYEAGHDLKEIATKMGWSYEWTRIKLNRLFKKLKDIYAD